MTPITHSDAQAERSAETRSRILDAALSEFAANGLAGARTEQIAVAAGVNKALLYYYFESKEKMTRSPRACSRNRLASWQFVPGKPVV